MMTAMEAAERIRLLEKQHAGQLTEGETAELETLEAQSSEHLKEVSPRSRGVLDEFSDFVARMKAKVAAKKEEITGPNRSPEYK